MRAIVVVILSILICTSVFAATKSKPIPDFVIAIDDNGPVDDVILAAEIASSLTTKEYNLPSGTAQLYSTINGLKLNKQITVAVYKGKAVLILGEDISEEYFQFHKDIEKVLNEKKVSYKIIDSNQITTTSLLPLFEKKDAATPTTQNQTTEEIELTCEGIDCNSTKKCSSDFNCDDKNPCTKDLCEGGVLKECTFTPIMQGCNYKESCIPINTVIDNKYCSTELKMINKKLLGETCSTNHECMSESCPKNYCAPVCNGCLDGIECLEIGSISNSSYCHSNGQIMTKKDKNQVCENTYECQTGEVCYKNKCKQNGIFLRIRSWFGI